MKTRVAKLTLHVVYDGNVTNAENVAEAVAVLLDDNSTTAIGNLDLGVLEIESDLSEEEHLALDPVYLALAPFRVERTPFGIKVRSDRPLSVERVAAPEGNTALNIRVK
tara:strand:- start:933 stop:1259 length:327 start_codon:yes stop_codon:yes gene_type:complete